MRRFNAWADDGGHELQQRHEPDAHAAWAAPIASAGCRRDFQGGQPGNGTMENQ